MKKITAALLLLAGAMLYSQSSIFVMNNYNTNFHAVGRFFTGSKTPGNSLSMFAAPNPTPYGAYTMPSGIYHKYGSFDTSGGTGNIMDIDEWYVNDPANPANSGTYNYNDPFISSYMKPNNDWAGYIFSLKDISTGINYDSFQVGDPAIAANAGFVVNSSQIGATTGVEAEWFTISSGADMVTYFTIYP
ncbi:hypothetical protein ODZ84_09290 [Chryseobacterium fluminis]|uniref:hypothetical protein n=1 Tax=Chryseobacterium fluminis TaxID=2983606 RepID=UPI00225B28DD|nr:hypothetical protein [Chryseobacterium sp. MMS21-Ot14]UZT99740.1 hypothetical protein ODZ84_09290 [Chryseobacterium sp. MMS21-Ot14]